MNRSTLLRILGGIVLPFLLYIGVTSCKNQKKAAETPKETVTTPTTLAFEEVASGSYCAMLEVDNRLINTMNEWTTLWKAMHADQTPKPSLPKIDFEKTSLIASFMGTKRTGGNAIEITSIVCKGKNLDVKIIQSEPGRNCLTTMAITQPYLIVSIDKCEAINKDFDIEGKIINCN